MAKSCNKTFVLVRTCQKAGKLIWSQCAVTLVVVTPGCQGGPDGRGHPGTRAQLHRGLVLGLSFLLSTFSQLLLKELSPLPSKKSNSQECAVQWAFLPMRCWHGSTETVDFIFRTYKYFIHLLGRHRIWDGSLRQSGREKEKVLSALLCHCDDSP